MVNTGNGWIDALVAVAVVLTAAGVIWTKLVRPLVHGAKQLGEIGGTLTEIAQQFRPNGGTGLFDQVRAIRAEQALVRQELASATQKADDAFAAVAVHIEDDRLQFVAVHEALTEASVERIAQTDEVRALRAEVMGQLSAPLEASTPTVSPGKTSPPPEES